jgi:putative phosphoesterase, SbcD/Mre11-related
MNEKEIRLVYSKKAIPIPGYPALYLPELDSTVICDVHLGYEEELQKKGIMMPKTQKEDIKRRIEKINSILNTRRIIINGDIRHGFGKINKKEIKEIENFLLYLSSYYREIILIKGNHDTFIRPIANRFGYPLIDYLFENEILIIHGHKEFGNIIPKSKIIILGHEHPAINIVNEYGEHKKLLAILYVPTILNNVIVIVPPFSIFSTGSAINVDMSSRRFMSEITKKYAIIEEAVPFVIDEKLGTIEFPKLKLIS